MSDEIYQDALLKLAKEAPRSGRLEPNDRSVRRDNPLCGDRVRLDLRMSDGRIADLRQEVRGCLLCQAAGAIIGLKAVGLDQAGVAALNQEVDKALAGESSPIDELNAFKPVAEYRSRHDCVRLPFQALTQAVS